MFREFDMKTKAELKKMISDLHFAIAMEADPYLVGCLEHQLNKVENELEQIEIMESENAN